MMLEHVLYVLPCYIRCFGISWAWRKVGHLCECVNHNHAHGVAMLGFGQTRQEVEAYLLPLLCGEVMLLQQASILAVSGLVSLAEWAAFHKLPHIPVQRRPPEVSADKLHCAHLSPMACIHGVMQLSHNLSLDFRTIWKDNGIVSIPEAILCPQVLVRHERIMGIMQVRIPKHAV